MNKTPYIFLWFLLIAFLLWITNYTEPLRYVFLLRVPILVGSLLAFLPFIAIYTPLKAFLKNLFVLCCNRQLILVIVGTTLAGLATLLVGNVIFNNAHLRFAQQLIICFLILAIYNFLCLGFSNYNFLHYPFSTGDTRTYWQKYLGRYRIRYWTSNSSLFNLQLPPEFLRI